MTKTIEKAETAGVEAFPHAVLGRGYSSSELKLIKAIWTDTKVVAQSKMQLCLHLHELKKEMDANDPNAGNGGAKGSVSRFWSTFEKGDLPEYVTSNRRRAEEWLDAAKFAASGALRGAPRKALLALTPSTVCNLSRIKHPKAKAIAEHHLQVHEFIGHDAAHYLAKEKLDDEVLKGIDAWITANESKALVPSVIRGIEAKVEQAQRQSATPAHLRPKATASAPEVVYTPPTITPEQRQARNQELLQEQNIRDTRAAIEAPDREAADELLRFHKKYSDALGQTVESLAQLRRVLGEIATVKGTIYLDELREYQGPLGFNYLANDVQELQRAKDLLLEIVQVAVSHEGPQSIDWETINTEAI